MKTVFSTRCHFCGLLQLVVFGSSCSWRLVTTTFISRNHCVLKRWNSWKSFFFPLSRKQEQLQNKTSLQRVKLDRLQNTTSWQHISYLLCSIRWVFLWVVPYFDDPIEQVKIQTKRKNSQRYYTTNRLIRDLSSNMPNCYVWMGEFRGYLFIYRIGAGNTGKLVFVLLTTGAIYFTFYKGKIVFRFSKLHINSSFSL